MRGPLSDVAKELRCNLKLSVDIPLANRKDLTKAQVRTQSSRINDPLLEKEKKNKQNNNNNNKTENFLTVRHNMFSEEQTVTIAVASVCSQSH